LRFGCWGVAIDVRIAAMEDDAMPGETPRLARLFR
jgi:hypothetical protein